jgi:hypothetical protein
MWQRSIWQRAPSPLFLCGQPMLENTENPCRHEALFRGVELLAISIGAKLPNH